MGEPPATCEGIEMTDRHACLIGCGAVPAVGWCLGPSAQLTGLLDPPKQREGSLKELRALMGCEQGRKGWSGSMQNRTLRLKVGLQPIVGVRELSSREYRGGL